MNRFFPFWMIDPVGAERKIDDLSEKGFRLADMNFLGVMKFTESTPVRRKHQIVLQKNGLPAGAKSRGWECLCRKKLFYVAANDDAGENLSYASYAKLHSVVKCILFLVGCGFFGNIIGTFGAVYDMGDKLFAAENIALLIKDIIIMAILGMIIIIMNRCGRKFKHEDLRLTGAIKTVPSEVFAYSKDEEKQMLKDKRMIRRIKPGWFYSPDKAAEYVSRMNRDGWRFYRLDTLGVTFHFVKEDSPVRQAFVVDFQNHMSDEYYITAKEDGWKLVFTSITRTMGYTVWTRDYGEDEQPPEFYSDLQSKYRHARTFLIVIGIMVLMLLGVDLLLVLLTIGVKMQGVDALFLYSFTFVYTCLGIMYIVFLARVTGYFLRIRKQIKNK